MNSIFPPTFPVLIHNCKFFWFLTLQMPSNWLASDSYQLAGYREWKSYLVCVTYSFLRLLWLDCVSQKNTEVLTSRLLNGTLFKSHATSVVIREDEFIIKEDGPLIQKDRHILNGRKGGRENAMGRDRCTERRPYENGRDYSYAAMTNKNQISPITFKT